MIADFNKGRQFAHFQGNILRRDTNPFELLEARKHTKMLIRLGYFSDEYELLINFQEYLLPFFQKVYEDTLAFIGNIEKSWRDDINIIKEKLIVDGVIARKWKSETILYELVKTIYPDARFQYFPLWLEPQSLDIYIPSINVGIEYQGQQHYEPVDFFGGEAAFEHRLELDQRKRELCKRNGLSLIEWEYTTSLSKQTLEKKLAQIGINMNK